MSCMLYPVVDLKEIQLLSMLLSGLVFEQVRVTDIYRASITSTVMKS